MATIVYFDGAQVIEPGASSAIRSLIPVPAADGTFGNVVLIDTGSGAGYGYGSGINGSLKQGTDTIYQFFDPASMKAAVRGGTLWDIADYLFSPSPNQSGAASVYFIKAATTVAATLALTFTVTGAVAAGIINIKPRTEGACANGVSTTNTSGIAVCTRGYACKVRAGIINATAVIVDFYEGAYRGQDENGYELDVAENLLSPNLIWSSPEVTTCNALITAMNADTVFTGKFLISSTTASSVPFDSYTVSHPTGLQLFAGGTTVYNAADVDAVLTAIQDLDNSQFLLDNWGKTPTGSPDPTLGINKGAMCVANQKVMAHIAADAFYKQKMAFMGGGEAQADITNSTDGSVEIAAYYNNPLLACIHGGVKVPAAGVAYSTRSAFFNAAMACGIAAGSQPQIPLTYKAVRIMGLKYVPSKPERIKCLQAGVITIKQVKTLGWVINQGVNTMQQNTAMYYPNGTSPEISIMRIIHQLNKELRINAEPLFTGQNQNNAGETDVVTFVQGYLLGKIATKKKDNYIMSARNVQATLVQGSWNATYCFVPNGPINKEFFTGFMVDPSLGS